MTAAAGDQDVRRFDVAMDQTLGVGGVEGVSHLGDDGERALEAQLAIGLEDASQVAAVHVTHGDVQLPSGLARAVDRDDVRVLKRGSRL